MKRGRPRKPPDLFVQAEIVRLHEELRLKDCLRRDDAIKAAAKSLKTSKTCVREVLHTLQPKGFAEVISVRKTGNTIAIGFATRPVFRKPKKSQAADVIRMYNSLTMPERYRASRIATVLGITDRRVRAVLAEQKSFSGPQ